jgi:hypothetical protein
LKKADKLAEQNQGKKEEKEKMEVKAAVNISWKEWSNSNSKGGR